MRHTIQSKQARYREALAYGYRRKQEAKIAKAKRLSKEDFRANLQSLMIKKEA